MREVGPMTNYEEFALDMIVACQRMAAEHADRSRGFLFSGRNRAFALHEQWHAAFWAAEARRHMAIDNTVNKRP